MVDCLRDRPDPTGSSPGFQARLKPRLETRRLAGGISWSRRQSTMDSLNGETMLSEDEYIRNLDEELPRLALRIVSDMGVTVIPPVVDRPVRRIMDGLVGMDEVSVFSWPICDPLIHIGDGDVNWSHGNTERVCLLYPTGAGSVNNGTVAIALDDQRLDHWHSVVWDPGIVGSQGLSVCYDCLCLMALCRAVMSLVHDWAEWPVWTGTISGYCRTITWEVGYLPRLHPPCDVDRLCDYLAWQIKGHVVLIRTDRDENNSPQRCACTRGISLGVLSVGRILIMAIGWIDRGGGPMDCSDWTRVSGAVDFSPGGVTIGYIRGALCDRSSTDAAPVTGSLVFSALLDSLDVYCTAEFALCRLFCGTDCVWLARSGLSFRRVSMCWTMATEGAALVENRAGITFGVVLYVPWDAPEAVVDIHSEGVVPLRSIPDVTGLASRRSDAAECCILQGRDVRSVQVLVPDPRGLDQKFHDVTIVHG